MRICGLSLSIVVVAALAVEACAGDPASFRPAKGAADQPALKEAFRVKEVSPDCVLIGYVKAEGERALEQISETAANHGANSYLIVNENRDERVATQAFRSRTYRKLLAEAYRCMMSGDLPNK